MSTGETLKAVDVLFWEALSVVYHMEASVHTNGATMLIVLHHKSMLHKGGRREWLFLIGGGVAKKRGNASPEQGIASFPVFWGVR